MKVQSMQFGLAVRIGDRTELSLDISREDGQSVDIDFEGNFFRITDLKTGKAVYVSDTNVKYWTFVDKQPMKASSAKSKA